MVENLVLSLIAAVLIFIIIFIAENILPLAGSGAPLITGVVVAAIFGIILIVVFAKK